MGGQTASTCARSRQERIVEEYGVKIIGVINAIITEDRRFALMNEIGIQMAPNQTTTSYLKGKRSPRSLASRSVSVLLSH